MTLAAAPFQLGNVVTSDDYTAAATLDRVPEGQYVFVQVLNAAVFYRIQRNLTWDDYETFLGPWVGTLDRATCTGIAFRSAAPGQSAQVSASISDSADAGAVPTYTISASGAVTQTGSSDVETGDIIWSGRTSKTNALLCNGAHYDAVADPTLQGLWDTIGIRFGGTSKSDFAVPDLLDRVPVGAGGNTPLASNEGIAASSRHGTRHRHTATVTDPGHSHSVPGAAPDTTGAGPNPSGSFNPGPVPTTSTATTGISVGVGVSGSDPLDGPAFLGLNPFIVK